GGRRNPLSEDRAGNNVPGGVNVEASGERKRSSSPGPRPTDRWKRRRIVLDILSAGTKNVGPWTRPGGAWVVLPCGRSEASCAPAINWGVFLAQSAKRRGRGTTVRRVLAERSSRRSRRDRGG